MNEKICKDCGVTPLIDKRDVKDETCGICKMVNDYEKQIKTLKADNDRITKALEEIKDPPCRVDCKPDDCDSAVGCSYLIKKALQE